MADDPGGTTTANGGQDAAPDSLAEVGRRLDAQESKLDGIAATLARLVPGSHADAQQRTEDRLDRPSTVEEQVQAELAKAREAQARADKEKADGEERETLRQRLAKLEERPPAEPVRRATRMLGWGDK